MDERHFQFYDVSKRLKNQELLLEELIKLGFEIKGKYILTTSSIGIPITTMLIILKNTLKSIKDVQEVLLEISNNQPVFTISTDKLIADEGLSIVPGSQHISSQMWDKKSVWYLEPTPSLSGSVAAYQTTLYKPKASLGDINSILFSTNQNVNIYKPVIHSLANKTNMKVLFELYKNIIIFLEFTYAFHERISSEIKQFNIKLAKSLTRLPLPTNFDQNCSRRGAFIHDGTFKLAINPENSLFLIGDKDVLQDSFQKTYDEAILWADQIYGEMLRLI